LLIETPNKKHRQAPGVICNVKTDTLKQLLIILTFVILCNKTFAQVDDCQVGTDCAMTDFSKGILRTYIFGLTNSFTFGKILKDEYGIDAIYWGCIVEEKWDCYSK
jgi:hypothetical protein